MARSFSSAATYTLPGLSGPVEQFSGYVQTSATGEVAFIAYSLTEGAVYRWTEGGSPTLAALQGAAIPGIGGTFPGFGSNAFRFDATGQLWMDDQQQTIFRLPRTGNAILVANDATPCPTSGGTLGAYAHDAFRVASSGGTIATTRCDTIVVGAPTPFTELLPANVTPPGYTSEWLLSASSVAAVAPNGDVLVTASLYCNDDPFGTCTEFGSSAVYRVRGGSAQLLLRQGEVIGSAPPIREIRWVNASPDGAVAAEVLFDDAVAPFLGVIHIARNGTKRVVLRSGDPIPGTGETIAMIGFGFSNADIMPVSGDRVLVRVGFDTFSWALVRWSPTSYETVWAEGKQLSGTTLTLGQVQRLLVTTSGRSVVADFSNGVLRERSDGTFEQLVDNGMMIDLGLPQPIMVAGWDLLDGGGTSAGGTLTGIDDTGGFALRVFTSSEEHLVFVGGGLVVNSQADRPLLAGATSCDTGTVLATGDAECTLRAAIQLVNTRAREATIRFDLPSTAPIVAATQLPTITVPLTIDGTSEGRVSLTTSVSGTVGLQSNRRLIVRGLDIYGFGVAGILADTTDGLEVYDSDISDNAGHGVGNTNGSVTLENVVLSANGEVGAFATTVLGGAPEVRATNVQATDNDGAGLAADGNIVLMGVTLTGNDGPGAVVTTGNATIRGISIPRYVAPTTISSNKGDGLRTEAGSIHIDHDATIDGNWGWGLRARMLANTSEEVRAGTRPVIVVSNNGGGAMCRSYELDNNRRPVPFAVPCGGGGIFTRAADLDVGGGSRLFDVSVATNLGPGIVGRTGLVLGRFGVTGNQGHGVAMAVASGEQGISINPYVDIANTVSGNRGAGLWTDAGNVFIGGNTTVTDNASWGIYSGRGVGTGNPAQIDLPFASTVISGNGAGTTTCASYSVVAGEVVTHTFECGPGGGVFAGSQSSLPVNHLHYVDIRANAGPGVLVDRPVRLHRASIANNEGPGVVMTLDELAGSDLAVYSGLQGFEITGNKGEGIFASSGMVAITIDSTIADNGGGGIYSEDGDVSLDMDVNSQGRTQISNNGHGACTRWTIAAFAPAQDATPCSTHGVRVGRNMTGHHFDITNNSADGINAVDGSVTIRDATICGNGGNGITSESQTLTDVDTCGGNTNDDDDGGCLSATGSNGPWWLAAVLLLVRRRRRRSTHCGTRSMRVNT